MIEGGGARQVGDEPWRASVLINGFQSWDYAGIHPLDEAITEGDRKPPASSWWTAAICDGQTMFVAQVLKASRFATNFRWHYHRDEHEGDSLPTTIVSFVAEQTGSPLSQPEQRSVLPEELRLQVAPQSGLVSDPILLLYGDDGTATLRKALSAAGHAAGARAFPSVPRGWCSWYHLGLAVTEADIVRNASFLARRMPEIAKSSPNGYRPVIQLDDGWMPRWQRWGDWIANEFFAGGLHALATTVHRHRLEVGIWLAPFHVAGDSQLAASQPDWLLKASDGAPQMEDGKAGPPHVGFPLILSMARNQAARLFFDRSLFAVDADVVMAPAPQLTPDEARVMITIASLSGGIFMLSDDLETLPADRLALLRNPNVLALVGGPAAEPVHLFSAPEREAQDHWFASPQELPPLWDRRDRVGSAVVAVYNWSDAARPYRLLFSEATGAAGSFSVADLWSPRRGGRALGIKTDSIRLELPPHSARLLRMKPAVADAQRPHS